MVGFEEHFGPVLRTTSCLHAALRRVGILPAAHAQVCKPAVGFAAAGAASP